MVKVGNNTSTSLILNTGSPKGCVPSPILESLFTHDCVATHTFITIIMFADNTTVVGLQEVGKGPGGAVPAKITSPLIKELNVDFRNQQREHTPIHINGPAMEKEESFKFVCVHITDNLKWSTHTDSVVKKAQQCLFNFRRLKKFGLAPKTLTNFYRCTIESILSGFITTWYGNYTALNRRALQRVVRSAHCITRGKLPALHDT
ncbi:uncharacterized protein [Oncorhynchus clarkii lewisi]|uniref:uncharacterized protein n=1 Tax=Oncorhynchus clarkii lewisi TaxID=490388 RepID=UPI0039B9125A